MARRFFWNDPTIGDDPLLFVDRGHALATARLLLPPLGPVSLRHAASGAQFEEGRDFAVDRGAGIVARLAGSRIPVTAADELLSPIDRGGSEFMFTRGEPRRFLLFDEEGLFHRRQVQATYPVRLGEWSGPVPSFAGDAMPRTLARLRAGEPLTIAVTGDSISEGYNASGFVDLPPQQMPYANLVADGLAKTYGSSIALRNFAVAGSTSDRGFGDVAQLAAETPDLVIVAFGMNDAGHATAAEFSANVAGIIAAVRGERADVEFVLVSPMLPNAEWHYPILERFDEYRDALARLTADGVVLADVTTMWRAATARKSAYDLTGNGINHPNDFGHRIYADVILARLVADR